MKAAWLPALTLMLLNVGAIAAPLPPEACAACRIIPAPDIELCGRALGALAGLGRWRDAFLVTPRYQELFPLIYWHTTRTELALIAEGKLTHPNEALRLIDLFYDAYAWNRARFERGEAPEPHWRAHFALASEADHDFGQIGRGMAFDTPDMVETVLGFGVLAHIDHDLPRSLRASFGGSMDTTATFALDFRRADAIFTRVVKEATADIGAAVRATSNWDETLIRSEVSVWYQDIMDRWEKTVLTHRQEAWRVASGSGMLVTGMTPHPPPMPRPMPDCP